MIHHGTNAMMKLYSRRLNQQAKVDFTKKEK